MKTPDPLSLAKKKVIALVRPGQWWLDEYEDGHTLWAQCTGRLEWTNADGSKVIELRGVGTDAYTCELRQYRDHIVATLTEAQGRRCGLQEQRERAYAEHEQKKR